MKVYKNSLSNKKTILCSFLIFVSAFQFSAENKKNEKKTKKAERIVFLFDKEFA